MYKRTPARVCRRGSNLFVHKNKNNTHTRYALENPRLPAVAAVGIIVAKVCAGMNGGRRRRIAREDRAEGGQKKKGGGGGRAFKR